MADTLDIAMLRTFVAIDDCGGFGRAAAAIRVSQPTVSQHVRSLERRLGVALVEKAGRGSRFTRAGERLLIEARRIITVHDEALARLDISDAEPIVIGSTETAAEQVLPELLRVLRTAYPERTVQFHIDRSTQMIDVVGKGTIDLAVVLETEPTAPGIDVGTIPLRWFAAPSWLLPAPGSAIPLVAYIEPCGMRGRALALLREAGRTVEIAAESGSLEGVLAAARAGLGVAVLPSAGDVPVGLVVHTELPELGDIHARLITRRGIEPSIVVTAADALEEFFASRSARPVAAI